MEVVLGIRRLHKIADEAVRNCTEGGCKNNARMAVAGGTGNAHKDEGEDMDTYVAQEVFVTLLLEKLKLQEQAVQYCSREEA